MRGHGRVCVLIGIIGVIASSMAAQSAGAKPTIPTYAARLAGGTFDQGAWSIWVFGHRRSDQCWATKTVEKGSTDENAFCGFSVPGHPWQFAARGTFGVGKSQESMLFFLTRKNVVSLKIQVETDHKHEAWIRLRTHRLTAQAASNAQIKPNFGYAVGTTSRSLSCVDRVVAVTQSGKKISGSESKSCGSRRRALRAVRELRRESFAGWE